MSSLEIPPTTDRQGRGPPAQRAGQQKEEGQFIPCKKFLPPEGTPLRDSVSDHRERHLPWDGARENPSDFEPFGSKSLETLHYVQGDIISFILEVGPS